VNFNGRAEREWRAVRLAERSSGGGDEDRSCDAVTLFDERGLAQESTVLNCGVGHEISAGCL
jgi:hypothetical protein